MTTRTGLPDHYSLATYEANHGISADFEDRAAKGGWGSVGHVQGTPDGLDTAKLTRESCQIIQAARREREWEQDKEHRS